MTAARSQPPQLPGFSFVDVIGTGGFADVFLYQQEMPRRQVAIKVLLESAVDGQVRDLFNAEANVMAQLSGHPSIVPIYQAGVSGDDRPYLVMEYCPPPHLSTRYRSERIPVDEVLEIAIKVSSAVETAHRAGILHRDIKPHNILTNAYGAPMLTDFGISATTGDGHVGAGGMSVPWSPPEAFLDEPPADVRSDVFALAATTYSLLAGRSPFEIAGAANDNATLMTRIERQSLARITRPDVPDALNDVLERGMAKDIAHRHPSALAFARALQDVQSSLHLPATRVEVLDASRGAAPVRDEDNRTHVRPVSIIIPDEIAERGTRLRPIVVPQVDDRTSLRPASRVPVPDTMAKGGAQVADHTDGSHFLGPAEAAAVVEEEATSPRRRLPIVLGVALAMVLVAAVVVAMALSGEPQSKAPEAQLGQPSHADAVIGTAPPKPTDVSGTLDGRTATFAWTNPDPRDGDTYRWALVDSPSGFEVVEGTSVRVEIEDGQPPCIRVVLVRADGMGSGEAGGCVR